MSDPKEAVLKFPCEFPLKAVGKGGEVVFDGPVNTDEELETVPEDVRDKMKSLEQMKVRIHHHSFEDDDAPTESM